MVTDYIMREEQHLNIVSEYWPTKSASLVGTKIQQLEDLVLQKVKVDLMIQFCTDLEEETYKWINEDEQDILMEDCNSEAY